MTNQKTKRRKCKTGTRINRKTGICERYKLTTNEINALVKYHVPESASPEERNKIRNQLKAFKYSARYKGEFFQKTGNRTQEFQDVYDQAAAKLAERNKGYLRTASL